MYSFDPYGKQIQIAVLLETLGVSCGFYSLLGVLAARL